MTTCKRGGEDEALKKNDDDTRICFQVKRGGGGGGGGREVKTYQLYRLVEVMVAHVYSVLDPALV